MRYLYMGLSLQTKKEIHLLNITKRYTLYKFVQEVSLSLRDTLVFYNLKTYLRYLKKITKYRSLKYM